MNFIFLRFMEVWTQRVPCKVLGVTYFARDPLRSYFHEPQKNEIYFLNVQQSSLWRDVCQTFRRPNQLFHLSMTSFTCDIIVVEYLLFIGACCPSDSDIPLTLANPITKQNEDHKVRYLPSCFKQVQLYKASRWLT